MSRALRERRAASSAHSASAGGYVALGILALATVGGIIYAANEVNTAGASESAATPIAVASSTPEGSPSETDEEISTPSATPTIDASAPIGSTTWTLESTEGYTETVEVSVSEPVTGQELDGVAIGGNAFDSPMYLSDVCSVDATKDAVIPVHVVVTNTTSGFDTYMSYGITATFNNSVSYQAPTSLSTDERFEVANTYKDGDSACTPLFSTGVNAFWSSTFTNGENTQDTFYVIVHDYRTPAVPDGDSQVLALVHLVPMNSTADAENETDYYTAQTPTSTLALNGASTSI